MVNFSCRGDGDARKIEPWPPWHYLKGNTLKVVVCGVEKKWLIDTWDEFLNI
jgi:hypothetical protein